jgi:ATP-binding cassette subfamily F protein 3
VFAQHHVDGLDLTQCALAVMVRSYPGVLEQELRSHLGSFGVSGPLALQPIYTLSGGQKSRVALAKLTWPQPNLLLLGKRPTSRHACAAIFAVSAASPHPQHANNADEVTNHLDIDAIDALIEGLAAYKGGVLLVSHDQYFISAVADELWAVEGDGTVHPFPGTFEEYKKSLRPRH